MAKQSQNTPPNQFHTQRQHALKLQAAAIEQAAASTYHLDDNLNNLSDTNSAWQCLSDLLHFSNEDPNTRELGVLVQILLDKQIQQTQMLAELATQTKHTLAAAKALSNPR